MPLLNSKGASVRTNTLRCILKGIARLSSKTQRHVYWRPSPRYLHGYIMLETGHKTYTLEGFMNDYSTAPVQPERPSTILAPSRQTLSDTRGRPLRDLRISVTDRCNFRCTYCMPKEVFGKDFQFLERSNC